MVNRLAALAAALVLVPPALARADAAKCTKTLGKQIVTYAKLRQKAIAACEGKRSTGKLPAATVCRPQCDAASSDKGSPCRAGTDCPGGSCLAISDAATGGKLTKAIGRATAKIAGDCATLGPVGPGCDGSASTASGLADCVTGPTQDADVQPINVDTLSNTIFDGDAPISDSGLQKCQAAIGKEVGKYLSARMKAGEKCEESVVKGKITGPCPEATAFAAMATARTKLDAGIRKKCTETQLAASASPQLIFGAPCEAYKVVTFERGPSNTNAVAVLDRFIPCIADASAGVADRMLDIAYPSPETSSFSAGVAAGDATEQAVVFWTEVPDSSMSALLEVATDPGFTSTVVSQTVAPAPGSGGTIKYDATGLTPATTYYYRFTQGTARSRVGSVKTAPSPATPATVRIGWTGDANAFFRPFTVLDPLRQLSPDAWMFIGDTIYGDDPRSDGLDAATVGEYATKYLENRADAPLRDLMATAATYVEWDDHEVRNDFSGTAPVFATRMAAGNLAFRRYNPIREDGTDPMRLYRSFRWGSLAEFFLLDLRQYRSPKYTCCSNPAEDGPVLTDADSTCTGSTAGELLLPFGLAPSCAAPTAGCQTALCDPSRTYVGAAQKAWLESGLLGSGATFKFVMNGPPITQLLFDPYDRWEGYPVERDAILSFIESNGIRNVVWLSTDLHGFVVSPNGVNIDGTHPTPELVAGAVGMDTIFRELPSSIVGVVGALPGILTQITQFDIDRFNVMLITVTPGSPATATLDAYDRTGAKIHTVTFTAAP